MSEFVKLVIFVLMIGISLFLLVFRGTLETKTYLSLLIVLLVLSVYVLFNMTYV